MFLAVSLEVVLDRFISYYLNCDTDNQLTSITIIGIGIDYTIGPYEYGIPIEIFIKRIIKDFRESPFFSETIFCRNEVKKFHDSFKKNYDIFIGLIGYLYYESSKKYFTYLRYFAGERKMINLEALMVVEENQQRQLKLRSTPKAAEAAEAKKLDVQIIKKNTKKFFELMSQLLDFSWRENFVSLYQRRIVKRNNEN